MSDTKNNQAWEKLFEEHQIIDRLAFEPSIVITANEIKKYREPRLMTKFDHISQLPKLFSANNLSILPVTRGSYVIAPIETFQLLPNEQNIEVTRIDFIKNLESLNVREITSETIAINCTFVAGILQDFTGEPILYPTVNGRMGSSKFSFNIKSQTGLLPIVVDGAQIEIDGGFEGDSSLTLIEAKNYICDDFLVRQLYYPYRLWSSKIQKKVRPIFLTYSNGVFLLREYAFTDLENYNSLHLINARKYTIKDGTINIETIESIISETKSVREPEIPFPQADSFERVINLCELLADRETLTRDEITFNYDFDERQTNYYTDAGRYLGLIEKNKTGPIQYSLTRLGKKVFNAPIHDRQLIFIQLILQHKVFKQTLIDTLKNGAPLEKNDIVEIMYQCKLYHVGARSTYYRRASTINSWINWILGLLEE